MANLPLPSDEQDETTTRVVELFKFYWQKFLSQQRILEDEEKLLKHSLEETEQQARLQKVHDIIDNNFNH
jgi:hypothetical protein